MMEQQFTNLNRDGESKNLDWLLETTEEQQLSHLSELLAQTSSLTDLSLANNNLSEEVVCRFSELLKSNSTLTQLNLSDNNIGDGGFKCLFESLESNSTLIRLDIGGNVMNSRGLNYIIESFRLNSTLLELNFDRTKTYTKEEEALIQIIDEKLEENSLFKKTAEELDLSILVPVKKEYKAGCFGTISEATLHNKPVIVKALHDYVYDVLIQRTKFVEEIKLTSNLKHRNILSTIGYSINMPNLFLCSKKEQASMADVLAIMHNRSMKWRLKEVLRIGIDICRGMEYIHRAKIIHRDLHLNNLLVSKDCTIKICDFGFSKFLDSQSNYTPYVGALIIMAPEMGLKKYSYTVDIWSFGIIIGLICSNNAINPTEIMKDKVDKECEDVDVSNMRRCGIKIDEHITRKYSCLKYLEDHGYSKLKDTIERCLILPQKKRTDSFTKVCE
eukprot:TRINITY_DN1291_c0_g1_i4.p1 TRINITY_DN1291_c0_g1~~TRINITY_DN1291_c0_g1_i4.p1  ORF type:complete len:444 (-),score=37.69 TRINITY_DN1291_c0_g1_i4:136-1467(-)